MKRKLMTAVVVISVALGSAFAIAQATKSEQVKCPVCGLMVEKSKALTTTHKGKTYYFESKTDYEAFLKNPEKYIR
jgi:YHS domain-containing protein